MSQPLASDATIVVVGASLAGMRAAEEIRHLGHSGEVVLIGEGQIKINKPVFFATNKDTVLKKSAPLLKAVGLALTHTPGIRKVLVEGHTDNKGNPDKNIDLSQRRNVVENINPTAVGRNH